MYSHLKYQDLVLPCIAFLIMLTTLLCTPVCAGLTVSGGKYMGEIAPGETFVQAITVSTANRSMI